MNVEREKRKGREGVEREKDRGKVIEKRGKREIKEERGGKN